MSKFELGQFLISLGCEVDLSKFGRQLLQRREWGSQQSKPATGRRGMMVQIQQIDSWRSSFGSNQGDPVPPQLWLASLDDDIPTTMVMQFHLQLQFKWPFEPPKKFRIDSMLLGKQSRTV